jgi:hypothetical protein
MIKLTLAIVNGLRKEFEEVSKLPLRDKRRRRLVIRLADKAGISVQHVYSILSKRAWKDSTITPKAYQRDLFEEYLSEAGATERTTQE